MAKLIRKDLILLLNKSNLIFLVLYFLVYNLALDGSDYGSMISIMVIGSVYILTNLPFSYDMTTKSHILIQSLPIKKVEIVISKYIAIFINYIIGIILVGSYLWITSLFGSKVIDGFTFSLIRDTLPAVLLSLAISLPTQFKFPAKVANFINVILIVIFMDLFMGGYNIIKSLFITLNMGSVSLLTISILVYIISMLLSIWVYENRNFV